MPADRPHPATLADALRQAARRTTDPSVRAWLRKLLDADRGLGKRKPVRAVRTP